MDTLQKRITIGVMVFALLACLICPWLLSSREPSLLQLQPSLSFNAANAYQLAQEFVTQHPERVFGTLESRQSSGFLHDYLAGLHYSIDYSHFDGRISRRAQAGRNVLAYKQGQIAEMLVLITHYDTPRTTGQEAMDSGASIGIMLELARIFSEGSTHRSLLFVFSDGGEWGSLGARDLADSHPFRNNMAAVLALDRAGIGNPVSFCLEETGQLKGFTPPWLRLLAGQAAAAQGFPIRTTSLFQEHIKRALLISWADQGPFLAAGIPAVNLGSEAIHQTYTSRERERSAPDQFSIEKYGLAAERIMRALDNLPSIPRESSYSFKLWDALFMWPKAILPLHCILFLPLPVICYFHFKGRFKRGICMPVMRELLAWVAVILPFIALYCGIQLAGVLRLFPFFELYPANPKDPTIANPQWGLLTGIFGAALFVAVVCYAIAKYALQGRPKPAFIDSKAVLLSLMTIIVALALLYNSYWATSFLLLPAWIWTWMGGKASWGKRIGNAVLVAAAGVPCCFVLGMYASKLQLGWNFIWYQVLALSSGLFSAQGYLLGVAALSIGIRFLAIQTHRVENQPSGRITAISCNGEGPQ
jgi:hypothetical protein